LLSHSKSGHKILFVEDQPERSRLIREAFDRRGRGARLEFVPSAQAAIDVIKRETVDALFFNRILCGLEGYEFLQDLNRDDGGSLPVVMIDAREDTEAAIRAIRDGIDDCVADDERAVEAYPAVAERAIARHEAGQVNSERSRAIIRSQKQWMSILDAITDYIFVLDDRHRLLKVNHAFAAAFGLHPREVVGKQCSDLFGTDILSEVSLKDTQHDGKPRTYEKAIGEETYQISIFSLREGDRFVTIHVMKNITELKRLKDQLHHADKLASIGLLVSGVAHEINNPLTGTIAYAELLNMKTADESMKQDIAKILESAERCKKIVDNLLTFSRQRAPSKSLESINDIIDRVIDLRGYWLRSSGIEVVRDYDPVSTVFIDAQQIQQVVLNILLNAEQAIVDSGQMKGLISFTTRYRKADRRVMIRVTDNGPGIPQRFLTRIFDPFFTTKPVGIGTGLGLSISHGIVTEHGGTIQAENAEEGGAAFTIELPTGAGALQSEPERTKGAA